MTVVVDSRHDVNLETLRRVALEGESVRLSERAAAVMARAHASFQDYVAGHPDTFIYMVTAGAGPDVGRRYTLDQARARRGRFRPFLGLAFGGGELPEYVSRAAVFAALSPLVSGNTATHPARARSVAEQLDGPLPRLPARGLVAAGELMPRFVLRPATDPTVPDEGFSAGTGNGAPFSSALAGLAAVFARRRLDLTEQLLALSIEALGAPLDAYQPALAELWGDPFAGDALERLASLLAGADNERRPSPAPASYQVLPRLLAQSRRALAILEEVATGALAGTVSNPAFVLAEDGHEPAAVSTGGFHNATAAPAIDAVAASWVEVATVAHRHVVKLHRGAISLLPDRLLPLGTDVTSGHSTTYLEYVPNQAVSEMRRLAQPTLLTPAETAASEQDDVAITAPIAYLAEAEVAGRLDEVLAVLAVTCSQALHVSGRTPAPPLQGLLASVRRLVPPVESRRYLGDECGRLARAISAAVEEGRDLAGDGVPEATRSPISGGP